jgi:predicted PurR-regulated permease PerM
VVFVVVVAALYFARDVLIPITLSILLSFILAPFVDLLRRAKLGRTLSVLVAVVSALGVILALVVVLAAQVGELVRDEDKYSATIVRKIDQVQTDSVSRVTAALDRVSRGLTGNRKSESDQSGAAADVKSPEEKPIPVVIRSTNSIPLEIASKYLSPALSPFATLGIVLVLAIFILLHQEDLRDRLIRLVGAGDLHKTTIALDDGGRRLSRYFLTQLGVNVGFGVVIGVGLFCLGVPSPLLWGLLAALLRFVPYLGPMLGAFFPMALSAAVDPGWSLLIWTGMLYLVVEALIGQAIEPLLYGHTTGLSPVAVVISAIFWSWIWGPIGLVISMPLTLCLVVLGRHVSRLEFLDVMLGDQPALTPVESFYQRILAGDSDEAREQAEPLLKDRSLTSYYDEVAIEGLRLAAEDAQRGMLQRDQIERIKEAVHDLIEDLESYNDSEPTTPKEMKDLPPLASGDGGEGSPPRSDFEVLCVAGRGLFDGVIAVILTQLLNKHGVRARFAPNAELSRDRIGSLDVEGVKMLCVCCLEITGRPAYLRYQLERLKRRLPGARIVIGLWPRESSPQANESLRQAMGADYYPSSLRESLNICLQAEIEAVERLRASAGPLLVAPGA